MTYLLLAASLVAFRSSGATTRPAEETNPTVDIQSPQAIARAIRGLESWPGEGRNYSDKAWLRVCELAAILSRANPRVLANGLLQLDAEVKALPSRVEEWSKAVILFRVMYDMSKPRPATDTRPPMSFGGFGGKSCLESGRIPMDWGTPVGWRGEVPYLTHHLVAYNGPPYRIVQEYEYFRTHYELRQNLAASVLALRSKIQGN